MKKNIVSLSVVCVLLSTYGTNLIGYAEEISENDNNGKQTEEVVEIPKVEVPPVDSVIVEGDVETAESTSNSHEEEVVEVPSPADNDFEDAISYTEDVPVTYVQQEIVTEEVAPESFRVEKSEETKLFIRKIGETARKIGKQEEIYASVMIAQAILETGSGSSQLSSEPYYNLFGIKGSYEGKQVEFSTQEDDGTGKLYEVQSVFKQYPGYKESFNDYADLMKNGIQSNPTIYAGTWKSNASSYQEATKALTGVYATDITYNQKLNELIEEYELTEYDKERVVSSTGTIIVEDSHPDSDFEPYLGDYYSGSQSYAEGNCTQYVYNRITQLGGYVETTMGNGMDWGTRGQLLGYEVVSAPKSGTAVSFQPNVAGADVNYGHVAFVEHVYEDGSILISEMNVSGLGEVSFRIIDQHTASMLDYITPK